MSIRQSILIRVQLAFLAVAVLAILIIARIIYLQTFDYPTWAKKAAENALAYRVIKANRGNIMSDDGSLLATSTPFYRIAIDPTVASDEDFNAGVDSLAWLLSNYFKEKPADQLAQELRAFRQQNRKYKLLSRQELNYQQKKYISRFPILRLGRKGGGVIFEKDEKRIMPFGNLARRTLGFAANSEDSTENTIGRGLEFSFNKILAGTNGQALFQKIAGGHWKPINDGSYIQPEHGLDIETTLNLDIQDFAEQTLHDALIAENADYGCLIFMEVATGAVKAIVNLGRNPDGSYSENNNYAVGSEGLAEPGSTFKMASFAALLEESEISLQDSIETGKGVFYFFQDLPMTDVVQGGYGKITVQEVFEKSSNIGTSKLVDRYFRDKPEKYLEYIKNFGFTQAIDFQMIGEAKPLVKDRKDPTWSGSTLPWMSVGYELNISPLHTLMFCNALANDGRMMNPFIVQKAIYANTVLQTFEPKVLNPKICSYKTAQTMRRLMEGTVERGTASSIKSDIYRIAGKTGTSEKVENGKYTEKHYVSFTGFFPAQNPKYSGIVVISNSKEGGYGGKLAAPVFRQISDFIYKHFLLHPNPLPKANQKQIPLVRAGFQKDVRLISDQLGIPNESMTAEEWVFGKIESKKIVWKGNTLNQDLVPNVKGMTLKDALFLLENKGLIVRYIGSGKVVEQSIRAGTKATRGRKITITLQ